MMGWITHDRDYGRHKTNGSLNDNLCSGVENLEEESLQSCFFAFWTAFPAGCLQTSATEPLWAKSSLIGYVSLLCGRWAVRTEYEHLKQV